MESKSMGFAALDSAKALIEAIPGTKMSRIKTVRVADREWFEKNKPSIESMVKAPIGLDKKQLVGSDMEIVNKQETPQYRRDDFQPIEQIDFDSYRPVVDDDAEEYIPLSER